MGVLVVGSVALDSVKTPFGAVENVLGGSASYFSTAASFFTDVSLVGVVGEDFPSEALALFRAREINIDGLERVPGRTFRWAGEYTYDLNEAITLDTQLNVFEQFRPKLPAAYQHSPYVFLANIDPELNLTCLQAPDRMIGWPRAPHPEEMAYIAPRVPRPARGRLAHRAWRQRQSRGPAAVQAGPDLRLRLGARHLRLARRAGAGADRHPVPPDRRHASPTPPRRCACWRGARRRGAGRADRAPTSRAPSPRSTPTWPRCRRTQRPRAYLARGPDGLETGLQGLDQHRDHRARRRDQRRERPERRPARPRPGAGRAGRGLEPRHDDHLGPDLLRERLEGLYWQGVDAVRAGRVYLSPTAPFGWIDRPPSLNRMIGLKWLAGLFYPDAGESGFARGDTVVLRPVLPCRPHRRRARPPPPVGRGPRPLASWPGPARRTTPVLARGLLVLAAIATFVGPYPISLADALRALCNRLSGEHPGDRDHAGHDPVLRASAAGRRGDAGRRRARGRGRGVSGPVPQPAGLARHPRRLRRAPGSAPCSASSCRCRWSASSSWPSSSGSARSASCC